ncbi:MAG: HPF/RaiA family ribosome-associated protein [Planctomycetes bacterium]|nr:HPF/RaiA family ribosome-associated protein [Planctomycetota bacterium]
MKLPLQVTFHNTDPLPGVEEIVRDRAARLDRYCDRITSCRVVIDVPHKRHQKGNQYQVRLNITVPGDEIAVTRVAPDHEPAKGLPDAIKDAFGAADRLIEEYVRYRRQDVKRHEEPPRARVRVVNVGQDFGFLETFDGREVYFHKNSLVGADFDSLPVGTEVVFVEASGEKGPQATTVRVVGRHAHA